MDFHLPLGSQKGGAFDSEMKQGWERVPCLQNQSSFMILSHRRRIRRDRGIHTVSCQPEHGRFWENRLSRKGRGVGRIISGHDQVALQSAWACWLVLHGHSHAGSPQLRNWCSHLPVRCCHKSQRAATRGRQWAGRHGHAMTHIGEIGCGQERELAQQLGSPRSCRPITGGEVRRRRAPGHGPVNH